MFFVADINGELRAFIAPIPQPVDGGTPTNLTEAVSTAAPLDAASTAQGPATVSTDESDSSATQDAAVFDGHAVGAEIPHLTDITAAAGPAASVMAYRVASALEPSHGSPNDDRRVAPVSAVEPAGESSTARAFGGNRGELPAYERVQPVEAHRPRHEAGPRPAVIAEQIMTSPVFTLREDAPVADAFRAFAEMRFRHIPIVSNTGRLVGIVSDRDFLPHFSGTAQQPEPVDPLAPVRSAMTTDVLTARPQTDIRALARVMTEHRIGAMPIVSEDGRLLGLVTRNDILRAVVKRAPVELWS